MTSDGQKEVLWRIDDERLHSVWQANNWFSRRGRLAMADDLPAVQRQGRSSAGRKDQRPGDGNQGSVQGGRAMNAQQLLEWVEILKKCRYGRFQADCLIRDHFVGSVPVEMPQYSLPDDDVQFDIGGSD